jgi:hypothetical protein
MKPETKEEIHNFLKLGLAAALGMAFVAAVTLIVFWIKGLI